MLRPFEGLTVTGADLLDPATQGWYSSNLFVRVKMPKTRNVAARRQFVKIDDPLVVKFLSTIKEAYLGDGSRLYTGGPGSFRYRWDFLMSRLGIPIELLTPGGLRTGGATLLFEELEESVARVRWRGRWIKDTNLEIYIQELMPGFVLTGLSAEVRSSIFYLSGILPQVLSYAEQWLREGVPSAWWPRSLALIGRGASLGSVPRALVVPRVVEGEDSGGEAVAEGRRRTREGGGEVAIPKGQGQRPARARCVRFSPAAAQRLLDSRAPRVERGDFASSLWTRSGRGEYFVAVRGHYAVLRRPGFAGTVPEEWNVNWAER